MSDITIRSARLSDAPELRRLAELDSQRVPSGELLVAEVAGELVAAYAPDGTATIADPFRPTIDVVELLRLHARSQRSPRRVRRARLWALPRPA